MTRTNRTPRALGSWESYGRWLALVAVAGSAVVGCFGCGGGESDSTPETTLPVQRIQLRVELMSPVPELEAELSAWQSRQGVDVVVAARDASTSGDASAPGAVVPSLREIEFDELGPLIASEAVTPFRAPAAELQEKLLGASACVREGRVHALPWRTDILALAVRDQLAPSSDGLGAVPTWQSLAELSHRVGPLAIDADVGSRLVGCYLALLWSAEGSVVDSTTAEPKLETDAAIEALSFLARLVQDGLRLPASEVEAAFAAGRAGIVPVDLERLRRLRAAENDEAITLVPFPRYTEQRGEPCVFLKPRLLVLPKGGAHADLAAELAMFLATLPTENADTPILAQGRLLPMVRDAEAPSDPLLAMAYDLRVVGRTLPAHARVQAIDAALERAIVATFDRRRHPELALADADRELQ